MNRARVKMFAVMLLLCNFMWTAKGDPVVLPTPPCMGPCPLICFQITDAVDLGQDSWRFEFEVLNWTQYHDPSLSNNCVGPLTGVVSPGAAATGLALIRVAGLSQAQVFPADTDPNGAPLQKSTVDITETLTRLPGGELGLELGCQYGFISAIQGISNNTNPDPSVGCIALEDCVTLAGTPGAPVLLFDETGDCGSYFQEGDEVALSLELHETYGDPCNARLNDWSATQCSANQIVWRRGLENGDTSIPAGESIINPCPTTCDEKDSGTNVLDGFVLEVRDFQVGDRLVFNWYLMDDNGPIAAGAPPTATDRGTLGPSPNDPLGFSYGSFQIDRVDNCLAGDCNTAIVVNPPITDPTVSCLVDVPDRNSLPFDFYVSMLSAGPDPDCGLEPALVEDEKGIERLRIRATPGVDSDRMTIAFSSLDVPGQFDVTLDTANLPAGQSYFELDPYNLVDDQGVVHTLQGRYNLSGACLKGTVDFSIFNPIEIAVPQRGDYPTVTGGADLAFEMDESTDTYSATGNLPGRLPGLSDDISYSHIFQIRDNVSNTTHIVATEDRTPLMSDNSQHHKANGTAPTIDHLCRYTGCGDTIVLGTEFDGGDDCAVQVAVTTQASDEAGSFMLTNDYDNLVVPSYTALGGGDELAQQTVFDSFQVGPPTTIQFTATDHAGNTTTRDISVQIVDDTPPVVNCSLVPLDEPPGRGGGRGNSGNNGNNTSDGGCSNRFQLVFDAEDNCSTPTLTAASIDGIDLMAAFNGDVLGKVVTILANRNLNAADVMNGTPNEDLRMRTPEGGVLSVTFTDDAGNQTTCLSVQSLPTVVGAKSVRTERQTLTHRREAELP